MSARMQNNDKDCKIIHASQNAMCIFSRVFIHAFKTDVTWLLACLVIYLPFCLWASSPASPPLHFSKSPAGKNTLFELNFKIGETFILSLFWRHRFLLLSWREKLKGKKRKEEKRDTYLLGVLGVQNTVVEQFGIWLQWVHFKSNYFKAVSSNCKS